MPTTIDTLVAELNKKYGMEIIRKGMAFERLPRIPFSSVRLNWSTYGGIPQGKVTELFGPDGGGKTTTALDLVMQAQRLAIDEWNEQQASLKDQIKRATGKAQKQLIEEAAGLEEQGPRRVLYVDTEGTLDQAWAKKLGVDTGSMLLMKPQEQSAEQILQAILDIIDSGQIFLCVLDSIPMLVPQQAFDNDMEHKEYGGVSQPLSTFAKKLMQRLTHWNTTFIAINQTRDDFGNPYNQYKTPGGRLWKHACSLRLYIRKGPFLDEDNIEQKQSDEDPAGNVVETLIMKTKICPANRRLSTFTLRYDYGIDRAEDVMLLSIREGFLDKSGSWLKDLETGETFHGAPKLRAFLREHPERLTAFEERLRPLCELGASEA